MKVSLHARSSLSNAPCRTRFRYFYLLAVDLHMAIGVEQHSVCSSICPTVYQTHDVVVVPPRQFGDLLVADRTKTFLFFPKREKLPFPFQVVYHLHAQALLEVPFPFWSYGFASPLIFVCRSIGTVWA